MASSKRILIVDDEESNRQLLVDLMETFGYESEVAKDGVEALAKMNLDIDLVLTDLMMPGMDGFEVMGKIRERGVGGDVPIIVVTILEEKVDRLRAVEAGADDFVLKPVDSTEMKVRMLSLLKKKELQDSLKRERAELEETVQKRTVDLRRALDEMVEAQRKTDEAHLDTIHRLALAAEFKDEDTADHIHRMCRYCEIIAAGLKLSPGEVEVLLNASPMHDVGKIGIPDEVLLKPGKLEDDEWEIMRRHTTYGARILNGSPSELLQVGEVIAISHHEKWDGSGYPNGLKGEDIPLRGRICAVADVFDALTSKRPYKKAFPNEKAWEILREGRGTHFDPKVLDVFFEKLDAVLDVQNST